MASHKEQIDLPSNSNEKEPATPTTTPKNLPLQSDRSETSQSAPGRTYNGSVGQGVQARDNWAMHSGSLLQPGRSEHDPVATRDEGAQQAQPILDSSSQAREQWFLSQLKFMLNEQLLPLIKRHQDLTRDFEKLRGKFSNDRSALTQRYLDRIDSRENPVLKRLGEDIMQVHSRLLRLELLEPVERNKISNSYIEDLQAQISNYTIALEASAQLAAGTRTELEGSSPSAGEYRLIGGNTGHMADLRSGLSTISSAVAGNSTQPRSTFFSRWTRLKSGPGPVGSGALTAIPKETSQQTGVPQLGSGSSRTPQAVTYSGSPGQTAVRTQPNENVRLTWTRLSPAMITSPQGVRKSLAQRLGITLPTSKSGTCDKCGTFLQVMTKSSLAKHQQTAGCISKTKRKGEYTENNSSIGADPSRVLNNRATPNTSPSLFRRDTLGSGCNPIVVEDDDEQLNLSTPSQNNTLRHPTAGTDVRNKLDNDDVFGPSPSHAPTTPPQSNSGVPIATTSGHDDLYDASPIQKPATLPQSTMAASVEATDDDDLYNASPIQRHATLPQPTVGSPIFPDPAEIDSQKRARSSDAESTGAKKMRKVAGGKGKAVEDKTEGVPKDKASDETRAEAENDAGTSDEIMEWVEEGSQTPSDEATKSRDLRGYGVHRKFNGPLVTFLFFH